MEARVKITNPAGLHARPAVKLAQLASKYKEAMIEVKTRDSDWIKARSAAKVMKLKASFDSELFFKASGDEAKKALTELVSLVERNFDESRIESGVIEQETFQQLRGIKSDLNSVVASIGIAVGEVFYLKKEKYEIDKEAKQKADEIESFNSSVAKTVSQLRELMGSTEGIAAEVIGFQLALVEDESLLGDIVKRIKNGESAVLAVTNYFANELREYSSGNEYFRSRASDLEDLRDRLLGFLLGVDMQLRIPANAVVVADDLKPSEFIELEQYRPAAIILAKGSKNAHVSLLARASKIPCLVQYKDIERLEEGSTVIVYAENDPGRIKINPSQVEIREVQDWLEHKRTKQLKHQEYLAKPALTSQNEKLNVFINLDRLSQLDRANIKHIDGIGLVRTELLFKKLEDEETQYQAYSKIVRWAEGKPVTIRTLDAGADKPMPGLSVKEEANPFLGLRGIRLSLLNEDSFRVQIRALLRAAVHGSLKVLLPMVSVPDELESVREIIAEELKSLSRNQIPASLPEIGIMVEVPAAALCIERYDADFFSIGSNDLSQYVMASSRDNINLEYLTKPLNPAVEKLMKMTADYCNNKGVELSICGEIASEASAIAGLYGLGLRAYSVSIGQIAAVKEAISRI